MFNKPMRYFCALLTALLMIIAAALVHAASDGGPANDPLHEKLLDSLREQRGAVSVELPDVHPVHTTFNAEAPIPPQCYTKTAGQYNPCYVCHQDARRGRENTMNDGSLQVGYAFSDVGMTNHWENLFEDRSERVAAISDEEILTWIRQDNYSDLPGRLRAAGFIGWIPDLQGLQHGAAAFDEEGFARDDSYWVAFSYKPLPSTFWPTNGSTDDAMIRLPEIYRTDSEGKYSRDVYKANLAVVEANLKGLTDIDSLPIDERRVGSDVDGDGKLGVARRVTGEGYFGAAEGVPLESFLYPAGTEFLHTVRYVGIGDKGEITVSTRMKEVRYMRKWTGYNKMAYEREYQLENFAKDEGRLPRYPLLGDWGLDNGFGWSVMGFIEGVDGRLRTQTYEENLFCMGCHSSIGATIDKTFSFPRKVDGPEGWKYINLRDMRDAPSAGEVKGEILTYLERVGGGGEFRSNPEMYERWFREDGQVDRQAVQNSADVYDLITPSPARALELNKAYRVIVADQDFIYGRDATVTPPVNVYDFIDNDSAPTLPPEQFVEWDIRLDWTTVESVPSLALD
jgi:hypothetical protein